MSLIQSILKLTSVFLSLSVVLAPYSTAKVWADSLVVAGFEPPPGRDAPQGGTAGGGSRPVRTACLSNSSAKSSALTALTPGRHLGLTQSERPIFFVYLPQTTAQMGEFSLFDEHMNGIYQVSIPVSQAGLISIHLPDTVPPLTQDKPYYWTFALACNPSDRTEDGVVGGWIERAQPSDSLKQELANATAVEQASLYAKQGFWYDAIHILVELEQTQPNNPALATTWAELLKSVGLDAIASKHLE
ncbi:MAG: DUF928 domain-containing protein [Cyanobacteriota bacterium]